MITSQGRVGGHDASVRGAPTIPWASAAVLVLLSCAGTPPAPPVGETDAAASLEVRCDGQTTRLLTPVVQAQRDGVHVVVNNVGSGDLLVGWEGGGDGAGRGEERFVFPILPGNARFRCLPDLPDVDPGMPGGWQRLEVLPPEGWVSPEIDCPGEMFSSNIDYVPGAAGVEDPLAHARKRADGDVVRAGYTTEEGITFVSTDEDGKTKESFGYISDGDGGWLLSTTSGCS